MSSTPVNAPADATRPGTIASVSPLTPAEPVVLDFGKQRRKQIKRLRRGDGKLMDDINGAIAELRTAGTIGATSQAVVIVVRQKPRKTKSLFPLL